MMHVAICSRLPSSLKCSYARGFGELGARVAAVPGERVHLYRPQQADLVVVPEHAHGHPANGCEFSDVEHDRCHDSRAYCVRLNAIPGTWPGIAPFRSAPGGLAAPGNEMYRAARQIPKAPRQRSPG